MKRPIQLNVRVARAEKKAYEDAAEAAGLTVGEWMRLVLAAATGDRTLTRALQTADRYSRALCK